MPFNLDFPAVCGERNQADRQEARKKRRQCCHVNEASLYSLTCGGQRPIKLARHDTTRRPGERFLLQIPFRFASTYSCRSHPLCPCHNFISLHVISKLALNEFLISLNSATVSITFIVLGFTIHTHRRQEHRGKKQGDRQILGEGDRIKQTS